MPSKKSSRTHQRADSRLALKLIILGDFGFVLAVVVVCGDSSEWFCSPTNFSVGKSSVLRQYYERKFPSWRNNFVSLFEKEVLLDEQRVLLRLYDTVGSLERVSFMRERAPYNDVISD